ncbi:MAG: hypothetical protein WBA23_10195, partial [Tunicatimonas sp.]
MAQVGVSDFVTEYSRQIIFTIQVFSLDQEVQLGRQLDSSIMNNPQEYRVLDSVRHADAYHYL